MKKIHYLKKEMSLDTVTQSLKRKMNFAPPGPAAPPSCRAGGLPPQTGAPAHGPARLWVRGEPLLAPCPPPPPGISRSELESEGNEECAKYRKAAAGAGGGGCWAPRGGLGRRGAPGPRRHVAAASSRPGRRGSRPRGPTRRGRRHPGRWSLAGGSHGFRLHSGRSSRGTPAPPGNRTGTRPAGWGGRWARSGPPAVLRPPRPWGSHCSLGSQPPAG